MLSQSLGVGFIEPKSAAVWLASTSFEFTPSQSSFKMSASIAGTENLFDVAHHANLKVNKSLEQL